MARLWEFLFDYAAWKLLDWILRTAFAAGILGAAMTTLRRIRVGRWKRETKAVMIASLGLAIISLASALVLSWWFGDPKGAPPVHGDLTAVYANHAAQLGKPLHAAQTAGKAVQAYHERATVIFIERKLTLYVLPADPQQRVVAFHDAGWSMDPRYNSEVDLRRLFPSCPPDRLPPFGGVATHWLADPSHWEWIGWAHWICAASRDQIHYQSFEHGIMMGVFHYGGGGEIFGVLDDGSWFSEATSTAPPPCTPIPHRSGK